MTWILDRWLDLWAWLLWPVFRYGDFAWPYRDRVRIWLISDLYRAFLFLPLIMIGGFYASLFSFAAPTSLFLLAGAAGAVWLQRLSRSARGPIMAGVYGEYAGMLGWASIGLLLVTAAQVWLNFHPGVSPAQFAEIEARTIDATETLRRIASLKNMLIALGVLLVLALIARTFKPIVALGALRKTASALLAIAAVLTSFTFVTAADTSARREKIMGQIVPRLRENVETTARARQETAAMRWTSASLAARPRPERVRLLQEIAAMRAGAEALCGRENAAYQRAYDAGAAELALTNEEAAAIGAAPTFCDAAKLAGAAVRVGVRSTPGEANLTPAHWTEDLGPSAVAPEQLTVAEARRLDTKAVKAAAEAVEARDIVRKTMLEGIGELLGPANAGVVGKVLGPLQDAVIEALALKAEAQLTRWVSADPRPRISDDVVIAPERPAELMPLSEAHASAPGRPFTGDEVAESVWRGLRPAATAELAAQAALVAVAAKAATMRAPRPDAPGAKVRPRARLPRF